MLRLSHCLRTCLMGGLTSVAVAACATTPTTPPVSPSTSAPVVTFQTVPGLDCCTLEFPTTGWSSTLATGSTLVTLQDEGGRAHITLEATDLGVSLDPADITTVFSDIEMDIIREQHPDASDFESSIITDAATPVVVTHYSRRDAGAQQQVRQHSFPRGMKLYRLIFTSSASEFLGYEHIFAHIAASFQVGTEQ